MASRLLTVAAALLVFLLVLVSYSSGYSQSVQSYSSVSSSYAVQSASLSVANAKLANLTKANMALMNQLNASEISYQVLLGNYTKYIVLPEESNHTFQIWGVIQTMSPHSWEEWDLLDTFVNHINIDTTLTSRFYIFDLNNFVLFRSGEYSIPLVNQTGTHFTYEFEPSVGCAVYVLFILNLENSSNTITPHVTATYAPSYTLTGVCAG